MFFVVKDGKIQAQTPIRENAIDLIRAYQAKETHFLLKSEYSLIKGEETLIPYKN